MERGPHTLSAFDAEQESLRALIGRMGAHAEAALRDAVRALLDHDEAAAARIVEQDRALDALEAEAERRALQLVALRAPMADDLREALAAHKVSGIVERIGDYAKNIAHRVPLLDACEDEPMSLLGEMARIAGELVRDAMTAFRDRDAALAHRVRAGDRLVDDYYNSLFRVLLTYMLENPQHIGHATQLMFVAKNVERIGDHATNIAELAYFAATGERLGDRQRGGAG